MQKSILALTCWRGEVGKVEYVSFQQQQSLADKDSGQADVPFNMPLQDLLANGIIEYSAALPEPAPVN